MYWWNVSKLAEDLRDSRVDEKERLKYYVATFIAYNVAVLLLICSGPTFDVDCVISIAVNTTAAVIGIVLCYRRNSRGDNFDFIARMICLGWPVAVRYVVIFSGMVLVMLVLYVFMGQWDAGPLLSTLADKQRKLWIAFCVGHIAPFILWSYYATIWGYVGFVAQVRRGQSDLEAMMKVDLSHGEIVFGVLFVIGFFYILIPGLLYVPRFVGQNALATVLVFLAEGLWALLFYSLLVWRRRSRKHA